LGPLGTAATIRSIVLAPGDYDDREIGEMIGRENRSTRRKAAPVPLCPPQTPHAARTRTRAAAVGSQRLTAILHIVIFSVSVVECRVIIYCEVGSDLLGSDPYLFNI
jgi:hypothetical protein